MPLVIRQQQIHLFEQIADVDFNATMIRHLRDAYAHHVWGWTDAMFLDLFAYARRRAEEWKIERARDRGRLIGYFVLYGRSFGATRLTAWAGPILADRNRDGRERMDEIDRREARLVAG